MSNTETFEIAGGDVRAWVEQGETVHLKAVDGFGDPVELTAEELRALMDVLTRLYDIVKTNR